MNPKNILFMLLITHAVPSLALSPNPKRLMLSELRGGDYAHAGDEEAIEIVLKDALSLHPLLLSGPILDVGCGLGGTLDYLKKKGGTQLYGVDIDAEAINYARNHYEGIHFIEGDALQVATLFPHPKFGFLFLFNSLYPIADKKTLLEELGKVAKPGALLAIFDYASPGKETILPFRDFSNKEMRALCPFQLKEDLEKTDWEWIETRDLTSHFIEWYEAFLKRLNQQEASLKKKFSPEIVHRVRETFSSILTELHEGRLKGVLIYASKRS